MDRFVKLLRLLSVWLFWPGVVVVVWGELTPHPPHLEGIFGWDKVDHFTAYFGLAAMATMVTGLRPRMIWLVGGLILFSGALELAQALTGRDAEIVDFVANSLGALSGALTAVTILLLFRDRALVARSASD
jgi:VanZ family protein